MVDPTRRITGARANAFGAALEAATSTELRRMGADFDKLENIVRVIRGKPIRRKVKGDFMGITIDGRALLVECKAHQDGRRPVPSDYEDHQIKALRRWHRLGGLAMTAWFDRNRRVIMVPAVEIVGEG